MTNTNLSAEDIEAVLAEVRPRYTLTPVEALEVTMRCVIDAIDQGIPGDLVECGTWLGGCSFAMLLVQKRVYGEVRRPVWMYDSFEGMSPPTPEDGGHAADWWSHARDLPKDVANNNYCIVPYEMVVEAVATLGLEAHTRIRKGWLKDTLPIDKPAEIAVLRVDCDWYEPVKCVLDHLVPNVSDKGSIIIDDYYAWEGAVLATHEYLTEHKLPWQLKSIPGLNGAWMTKRVGAW